MYIRRIIIENLRGFTKLDFDLTQRTPAGSGRAFPGWTVITGDNASGKSALLRAVAGALVGPDAMRALNLSFDNWVREGFKEGEVAVEVMPGDEDRFERGGAPYKDTFWSELKFRTEPPITLMEPADRYRGKKKGPSRGPWSETAAGWFCAGYGPFRRLYGHSPEAQRIMSTRGKVGRFATLFREDATLAESDLWLKELKYRELEGKEDAKKTLHAVLEILRSDFFPSGITVDQVDSSGLWLRHADGNRLDLRDMSDGFRSAAALVMDLLRHLVEVYGVDHLTDGSGSVNHAGVVLIDEIDAHLHPQWQREIGDWFKRLFPKIQFVVTTHSPLVCQAADGGAIFRLPAPGGADEPFRVSEEDYRKIIAGKPDTILLTPAFGMEHTRSPTAVAARREYSKLRAKQMQIPLTEEEKSRQLELEMFVREDCL